MNRLGELEVIAVRGVAVSAARDAARWDAYVASHPEASAYHFYAWREVMSRAFGHSTTYLIAEADDEIVGVLPLVIFRSRVFGRFVVSLPFVNYGGVLADGPEAQNALLDAAVREARQVGASNLELRHTKQTFPQLQAKRHKVGMEVTLATSREMQWQALDRKVRNQVRKAEKSGLRTVAGGPELLGAFYTVFARNMRDLGTPVYSIRWFQEIVRAFPDRSRFFVVLAGSQPVAASLVHWRGSTIEVPWASSLREFNPQCANILLYWEMIGFACDQHFSRFDLGRSTPGEGTFHFKRQWGAEPRELVWEYWTANGQALPDRSPKNPKFERAIAAWRRLPLAVTNRLGPRIVANIP